MVKALVYGVISWIVPFVFSFGFYKPGGELAVDYDLFKSIMIVVSSATGVVLLSAYARHLQADPIGRSIVVGVLWFMINVILDIFILVPMAGMTYQGYFISIGLRYLTIPLFSIGVGYIIKKTMAS